MLGPDGPEGIHALGELEQHLGLLPRTPQAKSGSGGQHLLFRWPEDGGIINADKHRDVPIDLRGEGGYFVAAPSCNANGPYVWEIKPTDCQVAEAPAPWIDWCRTKKKSSYRVNSSNLTAIEDRAVKYLAKIPEAISGQGGHKRTMYAARILVYGFDLGPEIGLQLLHQHYNPRCQPEWSEAELRHKCADADTKPFGEPRGWLLAGNPSNAAHSVPPLGVGTETETKEILKLTACSDLKARPVEEQWLLEGYFGRSMVTLFAALMKAGKTTWLASFLQAAQDGGKFIGKTVKPCRILYVTEEHESRWAERRDKLNLGDHVVFCIRPFMHKPTWAEWVQFVGELRETQEREEYDLIVFDTISNLWPVQNENDPPEVTKALMPLHSAIGDAGLLIVHHFRKSGGDEGTASRGTGAFAAWVDIIIELRRFNPTDHRDTRRVLTGLGRYEQTPPELVVKWEDGQYQAEGDRLQSQHNEIESALEEILPAEEADAKTVAELLDDWPRDGQPKRTALFDVLKKGHKANKYKRLGEGKRGKPYRYCVSVPSVPDNTVGTAGTETPTPSDEFAFCTHPSVGTETETVNAPGDATATLNPERSNKGPKESLGTETEGGGYVPPDADPAALDIPPEW